MCIFRSSIVASISMRASSNSERFWIQALSSVVVPPRTARRCTELLHPDARARRSKTASFAPPKPPAQAETLRQHAQMMSETGANKQPEAEPDASTNKPPSSEADSKKRAPTPESDDNSAELICKPQPKKPKTQKKAKVPVTKESVIENCKDGDAYVAKVLGTDSVDASSLLFCIISKGRWANARTVEARLIGGGLPPAQILWLVGTGEREEYEASVKVCRGGRPLPGRNRAWTGAPENWLRPDVRRHEALRDY